MPEPDICFQTAMSGFMWLVFVFCWCTLREEQDHKTHKTPIEARNQEAKVKLNVEPADLRFIATIPEDQKVQKFHLLFGPFPNNRIDFFIASTRTWLGSVMQMGRRRLRRDINFPSALLQAK